MVLLITDSQDEHSDAIALLTEGQSLFRFNVDLALYYTLHLNAVEWTLSDPYRSIHSSEISAVFVRKPFQSFEHQFQIPKESPLQNDRNWLIAQIKGIVSELIAFEKNAGHLKILTYPFHLQDSKLVQLKIAAEYFIVPTWKYFWKSEPHLVKERACVKPIAQHLLHNHSFIFTTEVKDKVLSAYTPWLLQEVVDATKDLTILFMEGKCFGYTLDRSQFEGLDWRSSIFESKQTWEVFELSDEIQNKCISLMSKLQLSYGRLDFLLDSEQRLYFLEVNPNGEWGWLDATADKGPFKHFIEILGLKIEHNPFLKKNL